MQLKHGADQMLEQDRKIIVYIETGEIQNLRTS